MSFFYLVFIIVFKRVNFIRGNCFMCNWFVMYGD